MRTCNDCGEGTLHPATWEADFRHYDGQLRITGLQCLRCDRCEAELILPEQIRHNDRRISDAKRANTGRLDGRSVRAVRQSLGLTQQEAATIFGGGANSFSKYERGEVLQSLAMDRLLKAAVFVPGVLEFLAVEAQVHADGTAGAVETYLARSDLEPMRRSSARFSVVSDSSWGAAA